MKFPICSITVIPESMNGPKNNRAIFYHRFTLVMYLLTFLAVLLLKDMVANGHSHWASYQQPFSQYLHHWPLKLVRSNASRRKNILFKLNWKHRTWESERSERLGLEMRAFQSLWWNRIHEHRQISMRSLWNFKLTAKLLVILFSNSLNCFSMINRWLAGIDCIAYIDGSWWRNDIPRA